MKLNRLFSICAAVLIALALVGCARSEQEKVWNSFGKAVAEKRVDEALSYVDFERMAQKAIGEDADAQAALALFGGPEGAANLMEGLFREALSKAKNTDDAATVIPKMGRPTKVDTEGDFSTLFFKVDGDEFAVVMERIDGEWKIVDFGDALSDVASEDAQESDQSWPGGPGKYEADDEGASITVDVPANNSHELVSEIEAFRKKAGAPAASYLVVAIDNTVGKEEFYLGSMKIVNEDGDQIEFSHVSAVIGDWYDTVQDGALYNTGVEISNKHLNRTQVLPGAKSVTVFVSMQKLPSIKSVWLDGATQMKKVE